MTSCQQVIEVVEVVDRRRRGRGDTRAEQGSEERLIRNHFSIPV